MRFDGQPNRRDSLGGLLGLSALISAGALPERASAQGVRTIIRDDLSREVPLSLPLKRVVIFNRYTTEFVRAIGAMPSVVGVDIDAAKHKAYWPSVTPAMWAGSGQTAPNFEAIIAMQPDAVFFQIGRAHV